MLRKTAEALRNACRRDDIIARWGGDEFIILLPKTDRKQAEEIITRITKMTAGIFVDTIALSISLGYETKFASNEDIVEVIKEAEEYMYRHKLLESPRMRSRTIKTIISTLNENPREEKHAEKVSEYSVKIGKLMELSDTEIKKLETLGLMHDIGKIGLNRDILNKKASLTDDEWHEIRRHPEIGYRILSSSNELSELAECVLAHHERWDGKGYPKGIKAENTPLLVRILAVADAFEAMTSERPYRKALGFAKAVQELKDNAGTQFDPQIVDVFVDEILAS